MSKHENLYDRVVVVLQAIKEIVKTHLLLRISITDSGINAITQHHHNYLNRHHSHPWNDLQCIERDFIKQYYSKPLPSLPAQSCHHHHSHHFHYFLQCTAKLASTVYATANLSITRWVLCQNEGTQRDASSPSGSKVSLVFWCQEWLMGATLSS